MPGRLRLVDCHPEEEPQRRYRDVDSRRTGKACQVLLERAQILGCCGVG